MLCPRAVLAVITYLLLVCGCGQRGAELLELHQTQPKELEPGGELYVLGRGFPTGRDGMVRLRGTTYRPGLPPLSVDWEGEAHALSSERISATVDPIQLEQLGNRGTFLGEVAVSFPTPHGHGMVQGLLDRTQIDLAGITRSEGMPRDALRHRALRVLEFIGLTVDETADGTAGVRVLAVNPGSPAADQGLEPADVLRSANHVALHSVADLAPTKGAKELALTVVREGNAKAVAIHLSLSGFELAILDEHLRPVAFLLIALLWFGAFYGPFTSPSLWVARVQSRIRYGESLAALGVWDRGLGSIGGGRPDGSRPRTGKPGRLLDIVPAALASSLLVLLGVLDSHYGIQLDAFQMYLAMAALLVWCSQRGADATIKARLARARTPLLQATLMTLIIVSTSLVTGARSLHEVVEHQGVLPHRWGIFTHPGLLFLFPVFVLLEGKPATINPGPNPLAQGLAYAGLVIARLLVCGLGAAVFLGGWASHELSFLGPTRAHLLAAVLFAMKAYGIALLLHATRTLSMGRSKGTPFTELALSVMSVAVTAAFVVFGLGEYTRLFSGTVLSTAAALVVITAGIRVLQSKAPMGSTPRHPSPFM